MIYKKFRKAVKKLKDVKGMHENITVHIEVWCETCKKWVEAEVKSVSYLSTYDDITIEGERSTHKE